MSAVAISLLLTPVVSSAKRRAWRTHFGISDKLLMDTRNGAGRCFRATRTCLPRILVGGLGDG